MQNYFKCLKTWRFPVCVQYFFTYGIFVINGILCNLKDCISTESRKTKINENKTAIETKGKYFKSQMRNNFNNEQTVCSVGKHECPSRV